MAAASRPSGINAWRRSCRFRWSMRIDSRPPFFRLPIHRRRGYRSGHNGSATTTSAGSCCPRRASEPSYRWSWSSECRSRSRPFSRIGGRCLTGPMNRKQTSSGRCNRQGPRGAALRRFVLGRAVNDEGGDSQGTRWPRRSVEQIAAAISANPARCRICRSLGGYDSHVRQQPFAREGICTGPGAAR